VPITTRLFGFHLESLSAGEAISVQPFALNVNEGQTFSLDVDVAGYGAELRRPGNGHAAGRWPAVGTRVSTLVPVRGRLSHGIVLVPILQVLHRRSGELRGIIG
jgi:hypothetical protein